MIFPHKQGLIPRLQQYLRYQSRFGYESLFLTVAAVAFFATGAGLWWLFGR